MSWQIIQPVVTDNRKQHFAFADPIVQVSPEIDTERDSICNIFRDVAKKTWSMRHASEVNGLSLGEETMTDIAMLHLVTHCPTEVKIAKFNKYKENLTGAGLGVELNDEFKNQVHYSP